ncbi:MAG TPA: ABC transporter ATP-binding protein [Nitrospirae bacterium]|nr:ABC transporter ATP-binding protein [Nitrospirota bacterium]
MIRLIDINKTYSLRPVLKDINLDLGVGEIFVLFGHNGAGKTTLLKIVSGIMSPTRGRVEGLEKEPICNRIFYLGHNNGLYSELTVLENVRFFQRLFSGGNGDNTIIKKNLSEFGLWQRRNDRVRSLSQGMKRRLALMKTLICDSGFIVLDEPFTGLDLRWKDTIVEKILSLRQRGTTVLITTHLVEEGLRLADRVGFLEEGKLTLIRKRTEIDELQIREMLKGEVCS